MNQIKQALLAIILVFSTSVWAVKTVDFVIPYAPGASGERLAVILIAHMRAELESAGMYPVLSFKPGAGSTIGAAAVARSNRLQIIIISNSIVIAPIVNKSAPDYDIARDFVALEYLGHIPMLLTVNAASPIGNIQDMQQLCRKRPLTYGSGGIGSATHLASAIVMHSIGCNATHAPYKGMGPAVIDLQGGHIDFATDFVTSIQPHIVSQTLKPIVAVDKSRNSVYPQLPSMTDLGYKDFDFLNYFILLANSSAPHEDIVTVQQAMRKMMLSSELQSQLRDAGLLGIGRKIDNEFLVQEHKKYLKLLGKINVGSR